MQKEKKRSYAKGFQYGRYEHRLESWTNIALLFTVLFFGLGLYIKNFYVLQIVFGWLAFSFTLHLLARACHGKEKKWHTKARNEPRGFFG